jgi:hypothetical protein
MWAVWRNCKREPPQVHTFGLDYIKQMVPLEHRSLERVDCTQWQQIASDLQPVSPTTKTFRLGG